jgi:hypothetical protein
MAAITSSTRSSWSANASVGSASKTGHTRQEREASHSSIEAGVVVSEAHALRVHTPPLLCARSPRFLLYSFVAWPDCLIAHALFTFSGSKPPWTRVFLPVLTSLRVVPGIRYLALGCFTAFGLLGIGFHLPFVGRALLLRPSESTMPFRILRSRLGVRGREVGCSQATMLRPVRRTLNAITLPPLACVGPRHTPAQAA